MSDEQITPEPRTEDGPGYRTRTVTNFEELSRLPEKETGLLGHSQVIVQEILDNCRLPEAGGKEQSND